MVSLVSVTQLDLTMQDSQAAADWKVPDFSVLPECIAQEYYSEHQQQKLTGINFA